ncbi:PKD domain-containing protein [Kribbella sp. NPDC048928]|uniref:PKD domain-containing protein n=1 Tax=Kribbella sp. NPDC048928 TaxID=3364111 RepID=UPI0037107961
MTHRGTAWILAAALGIALLGQSLTATAGETTTDKRSGAATGGPTPEVDPLLVKELVRLAAKSRANSHTYTSGKKTHGSSTSRKESSHKPVSRRPKTLTELQMMTTDTQLHRLNDGICNRLPDGTIEGPSRCKAWFEYLDAQKRRNTAQQAIDQIRTQIQQQTVDVPLPKLAVRVQPTGRTLVNLDTIVYTDQKKQTKVTVTLLGYPVTVIGEPVSYTWHFGDGTPDVTTTSPGGPYPSKEITHKYLRRGDVRLSVTVNYAAAFAIAGSQAMPIAGTLPITGPQTPLQVREAVPVLVDPGR